MFYIVMFRYLAVVAVIGFAVFKGGAYAWRGEWSAVALTFLFAGVCCALFRPSAEDAERFRAYVDQENGKSE